MKWQKKQENPTKSVLSKVEKIHNDQITKETPTTQMMKKRTQKQWMGLGDQMASTRRYST